MSHHTQQTLLERLLDLPLLWACFAESFADGIEPEMRNWICGAFISLQQEDFAEHDVNPVAKMEVMPNKGVSALFRLFVAIAAVVSHLVVLLPKLVSGTVSMDKMTTLPGEGMETTDP